MTVLFSSEVVVSFNSKNIDEIIACELVHVIEIKALLLFQIQSQPC